MGVPDTVTYEYMKRNEVFADAFNFLLYNGEKIISSISSAGKSGQLHVK